MDTGGMAQMKGKGEQRRKQLPKALKTSTSDDASAVIALPGIKMVRYRLDVGSKHQVTSEELKKILIEESGVDKNNIKYINIQGDYTLVELPDEMPQDIFLHLKSVEIKQRKLDIKRVKLRNKKRSNYGRRGRKRAAQSNGGSDQASGSNQSEEI
jgi:coenzyme F420-reducing hydrogenase beta subunit